VRNQLFARAILAGVIVILTPPVVASAQNTTFGTSVHMLAGQPPVRVTLATGSADRYYDAVVVTGRSYCAEATASETELNSTDPALAVFRADQTTPLGTDTGLQEPKGQVAARVCFVAPASETIYIKLSPASAAFENREYAMRFVETTLWANWFFVGGTYSSYTLLRNTTSTSVSSTIVWRADTGAQVGTPANVVIPANGVYYVDARTILSCPYPTVCPALAGSVEVAHTGSPEAIVGSQTTLSGTTGLSFDTIMFQRRAW
jgi:hypothetical protein